MSERVPTGPTPAATTATRQRSQHADLSRSTSPTGRSGGVHRTSSSRSNRSRSRSRNHSPNLGRGRSGHKLASPADAAGIRPVVTGPVYVRSQGQWRLGTLTVARDSLRFTSTGPASLGLVEVLLGCTDVARGRVLCSAEADHDPGVFEVEVLPSVRGAASKVVRELSVRASRDGRGECLWFKVGDMERATEWAEAVDDASQSAGDAAAGLIWDWFKVPAAGAAPAVFAFGTAHPRALAVPMLPPSMFAATLSVPTAAAPRPDDDPAISSITRVFSTDTLDGTETGHVGVAVPIHAIGAPPPLLSRTPSSTTVAGDSAQFVSHPQLYRDTNADADAAAAAPLELTLPLAADLVMKYTALARRRRRDQSVEC